MTDHSTSSPFQQERAHTAPAQLGFKKSREKMSWDLDETVFEINRSFFTTHLLPPSPLPTDVSAHDIVRKLLDLGTISSEGCWKGWTQPTDSFAMEDDVFRRFESLVEMVLQAYTPPGKSRTTEFKCNSAFPLWYHMRRNTSKSDCYGIPVNAKLVHDEETHKRQPQWADISVPGELEMHNSGIDFGDVRTFSLLPPLSHRLLI